MQQVQLTQTNKNIYSQISDLFCYHQFRLSQVEFFDLNCQKSENLEDLNLFTKYKEILEKTTNSKLLKVYNAEEIKEFYQDFNVNYELYKKISQFQQTFETLISFTDFEAFKKIMLEYHQRLTKTLPKKEEGSQEKPKLEDLKFDFEQFDKLYCLSKEDKCWEKILLPELDSEGNQYEGDIRIQKLNGDINIIRTEVEMKNCSPQAVVNASSDVDVETMKKKNPYIKEAFYVDVKEQENKNEKIYYFSYEVPMIGSKDMLYRSGVKKLDEKTQVVYQHSIELPDYPIKENYERNNLHRQIYIQQASQNSQNSRVTTLNFQKSVTQDLSPMFFAMSQAKQLKRGMDFYTSQCQEQQAILEQKK